MWCWKCLSSTGKDFMTGHFSWLKHIRDSVILYLISRHHKSIQALRRRAAVRGWFDSPILMRLMANLPLPAPFTDHVRFSWKEHTAASVLTCKHLNVTLCLCKCLRACLYKLYVSQGEGMSVSELWGQTFFPRCFWPQSSLLASRSSRSPMDTSLLILQLRRFSSCR